MTSFITRSAKDAWIDSSRKTFNGGSAKGMQVSTTKRGLLRIPSAVPSSANRTLSLLRLVQASNFTSGGVTITVTPLSPGFLENGVTWNRQPGVAATPAAVSLTKTNPDAGTVWEFDVTAHYNGWEVRNYGWRITSDSASGIRFHTSEATSGKPSLYEEWDTAPATPTRISPSGEVLSVPAPVVSTDFVDPGDRVTAVQVQASPTADEGTAWDSGTVTDVSQPRLDLATTDYTPLVAAGTDRYRMRVRDAELNWSGWSPWSEENTYTPLGEVTITVPAAEPDNVVWSATPTVAYTVTHTQAQGQMVVWTADRTTKVYESPIWTGTDTSAEVPTRSNGKPYLIDGGAYAVQFKSWDDLERAGGGSVSYAEAWRDFTLTEDDGVSAPTGLSAQREPSSPWWVLSWSRGAAPDGWEVVAGGAVVAVLDLDDVEVVGTTYRWRTATIPPMRDVAYAVRAVEDGHRSEASAATALTFDVAGVWIVDEANGTHVHLDSEGPEWVTEDMAATYRTADGRTKRSVSALPGYEGTIPDGVLHGLGRSSTFEDQWAVLLDYKENPDRGSYRLISSDVNIPVILGEILPAPSWRSSAGDRVRDVSLQFWQDGENEWTLVV